MFIAEKAERINMAGHIIATLYLDPPTPQFLMIATNPERLDHWPLQDQLSQAGIAHWREFAENPREESVDELRDEHFQLFRGPGRPLIEPHESARLSREHLVFDQQTAEVRECYRRAGLRISQEGREPDDHIGRELAFIAELMGQIANHLTEGRREKAVHLARLVTEFLDQHTLRFAGDITAQLRQQASGGIYRGLADLTDGFLQEAAAAAAELAA